MNKEPVSVSELLDTLESTGCEDIEIPITFGLCDGPDTPPTAQLTCGVCELIWRIKNHGVCDDRTAIKLSSRRRGFKKVKARCRQLKIDLRFWIDKCVIAENALEEADDRIAQLEVENHDLQEGQPKQHTGAVCKSFHLTAVAVLNQRARLLQSTLQQIDARTVCKCDGECGCTKGVIRETLDTLDDRWEKPSNG